MNKKDYKKKLADILSFKSAKPEKLKLMAPSDSTKRQTQQSHKAANNPMASSLPKATTSSETTQFVKKHDVIIIGAGLSGK